MTDTDMTDTDKAGQVLRWSGSGQYRPDAGQVDRLVSALTDVRTALDSFGQAAGLLCDALSGHARVLDRADTSTTDKEVPDTPLSGQ
jgi:hypothetical protein